SPIRKLIRITSLLLTLVILFNFFGFYLARSKSAETENLATMVDYAGRQRILSQTIMKDAILLLTLSEHEKNREEIQNNLKARLAEFSDNNTSLRGNQKYSRTLTISNIFEVRNILAKSQTHIKSILAVGN